MKVTHERLLVTRKVVVAGLEGINIYYHLLPVMISACFQDRRKKRAMSSEPGIWPISAAVNKTMKMMPVLAWEGD